jgi:hypothetical protein
MFGRRRFTPPPAPSPQGEGECVAHFVEDERCVEGFFAGETYETPALAFEMGLAFRVILRASGQIMHAAVDLNRNARFADGEVYDVAADFMLTHGMNSFWS